jgi:phosphoesterase RecJ-like protein
MYDFLGEVGIASAPQLEPDLAVVCDAATIERVGPIVEGAAEWFARARILNIDHHITNTGFGTVNLVDPTAAATCEVVHGLLRPLGVAPDAGVATALLAGIVRDSHGFADPATSPRTMRIVAALMEAGASLADVRRRIMGELPFHTITLWGRIVATARSSEDGRIVAATLTPRMLEETGTEQHDADGVVEFLATSRGAEVVLLLRDVGPNETRVSVRTSDGVDATSVAATFGGGGHARRAGCTVPAPLDDAVGRVLDAATAALAKSDEPDAEPAWTS